MAEVVLLPKSKKEKKLKIILIALVLLTAVILIFYYFRPIIGLWPSFGSIPVSTSFSQQKIDLNTDVFKDPQFRDLKSYDTDINVDKTGRLNPFAPY